MEPVIKLLQVIFLAAVCVSAQAAPPSGYHLRFNGNFKGRGGNGDGWLPLSEWGPLPNYVLGNELWYPCFIDHCPDHRDFGHNFFSSTTASQAYGRMTWKPYHGTGGWYTGILATVDPNGSGFHVKPPFFVITYMSMPLGSWAWTSSWGTTMNRLQSNQSTNSAEIDWPERWNSEPNRPMPSLISEFHANTRTPSGSNITNAPAFIYDPGMASQNGEFYSLLVDPVSGVHAYLESATWDGKPAGDFREVFSCPFATDMQQDWYFLVDYALDDRTWTGQGWTDPTSMWVKQFQIFSP